MDNYRKLINIAKTAQDNYLKFTVSKESKFIFLKRFKKLINK